jgi:hypothetical protein
MTYSKSASAAKLGITVEEFEKRTRKAGFKNTEDYWNSIGGEEAPLRQEITKQIVELDKQLDELTPYLSLSDEEKQTFLDKAVQEITPYYDEQKKRIEEGLQAGKVQTAEDILLNIREIEDTTKQVLAKYDLSQAETEEDFINRISDITATSEEDLTLKREDYKQRIENLKLEQIQTGTLTSGIGAKKVSEQERLKNLEEQILNRQKESDITAAETAKKYSLESIRLARQTAEQDRIRSIGTPTEVETLKQKELENAGLTDMSQLESEQAIKAKRAESGVTPISDKYALQNLEAEKLKAKESTAQELQADELAIKEQEYGLTREQILAEQAKKRAQLAAYGG